MLECDTHGRAFRTYICEHLSAEPRQKWYSKSPTEQELWPDAWCSICYATFERDGEWNDSNAEGLKIKLFCHRCYESHRALGTHV